jgi:hypothetical protein
LLRSLKASSNGLFERTANGLGTNETETETETWAGIGSKDKKGIKESHELEERDETDTMNAI